ncbi:MAG: arylsulfatase [Planctomycetota bacterium]
MTHRTRGERDQPANMRKQPPVAEPGPVGGGCPPGPSWQRVRSHALSAWIATFAIVGISAPRRVDAAERPNVVIVISDDQGYGDVACHGNPVIQTPNIDQLASESSTLSDYHVAPTCSPTRAALLTGHWTNRTGVWHTINGRSMLRQNEVTLGRLFQRAGYTTAMFGKWHLGDNYPYRAEDRGFDEVYRHGGGGVGQTPDVWDNAYFDGGYFHNGNIESAEGFCTDVFFDRARDFIRAQATSNKPFLAYIATNAPHGPLHCPQAYMDRYSDQKPGIAAFFGMITNIDDNVGKTRDLLAELGIADNTIFVFTTDNGTATGSGVFNADMRGKKGSPYEGGHRVPFMMHWPNGGMNVKHTSDVLTHAVDVVPTLLELCGEAMPEDVQFDGKSVASVLRPDQSPTIDLDRMLVTDSQRVRDPIKWRQSSVMQSKWRLINGEELYHIGSDPDQSDDVAESHPERVASMRAFYEAWWSELEPTFEQTTEIVLGHPDHPKVTMTAHDWIQDSTPPWHQGSIRAGGAFRRKGNRRDATELDHDGHWAVRVDRPGTYQVAVRRYPAESGAAITEGLPSGSDVPGASKAFRTTPGEAMQIDRAILRVDGNNLGETPVEPGDMEIHFETKLDEGSHELSPVFCMGRDQVGAFYCIVTFLGP